MRQVLNGNTRWANVALAFGISVFATGLTFAQEPQPADREQGGWRQLGPNEQAEAPPAFDPAPESNRAPAGHLTVPAGTLLTVRISQPLSSDHNQVGDGFMAVLQQPVVVDGLVIARRGQTVLGTVTQAEKAGRAKGVSHLGIAIGQLTLVDGQQVPVKTNLLNHKGNTSIGRDAVGIGATAGVGAAVGAGVAGGVGAGVGAAAGGVLGVAGVLLTRGEPTIIYPETLLMFRVAAPVVINTERSEQAFLPVTGQDYEGGNQQLRSRPPTMYAGPGPGPGYPPPAPYYSPYYAGGYPYYYGAPYYGYGYGYGFGPSFYFYSRPRVFVGGGRFYRR